MGQIPQFGGGDRGACCIIEMQVVCIKMQVACILIPQISELNLHVTDSISQHADSILQLVDCLEMCQHDNLWASIFI